MVLFHYLDSQHGSAVAALRLVPNEGMAATGEAAPAARPGSGRASAGDISKH